MNDKTRRNYNTSVGQQPLNSLAFFHEKSSETSDVNKDFTFKAKAKDSAFKGKDLAFTQ